MNALTLMMIALYALGTPQQGKNLYDPQADAMAALNQAVAEAQAQDKHVLVQVGGNWCPWCIKLHEFMEANAEIKACLAESYVLVKVNYSKENKNAEVLSRLGNPQRFGFPVLVVLNAKGERIHTQDTGLLESGDGYDAKKVLSVLKGWSKAGCEQTSRR